MITSYKLAIGVIAVLAIAWCAYTIYKNSQPQPKSPVQLNETKKETDQNFTQPTQQPETPQINTEPQTTQKSVTQPTVQPQIAENTQPTEITPDQPKHQPKQPATITVTVYGDIGQKEQAERNLTN